MPAPTFAVFEATLDPGPEPIPRHLGARGGQIGQDQPGLAIASVPARQPRTGKRAGGCGTADDGTGPPLAQLADDLRQGAKGRAGLRALRPWPIDPEEGMPAQRLHGGEDPVGIEAAIGQDNDGPVGRHPAPHMAQERFPRRAPGTRARVLDDAPGHGDGTPTPDHTDEEHGQPLP
jgi:hypothetical protein